MAWQDIKRALTRLSRPMDDPNAIEQIYRAYNQLAQQTAQMQSHVQIFLQSWGGGVTTSAVTLPIPASTANYAALVAMNQNSGTWWITARTTTTFTLNFVTAGAGSAWIVVVNAD